MLSLYMFGINLLSFLSFGLDKIQAISHGWRVPEKVLLFLAFLGGGPGGLLAMILFRHKINKPLFRYLVPLLSLSWLFLWRWFYVSFNL